MTMKPTNIENPTHYLYTNPLYSGLKKSILIQNKNIRATTDTPIYLKDFNNSTLSSISYVSELLYKHLDLTSLTNPQPNKIVIMGYKILIITVVVASPTMNAQHNAEPTPNTRNTKMIKNVIEHFILKHPHHLDSGFLSKIGSA